MRKEGKDSPNGFRKDSAVHKFFGKKSPLKWGITGPPSRVIAAPKPISFDEARRAAAAHYGADAIRRQNKLDLWMAGAKLLGGIAGNLINKRKKKKAAAKAARPKVKTVNRIKKRGYKK